MNHTVQKPNFCNLLAPKCEKNNLIIKRWKKTNHIFKFRFIKELNWVVCLLPKMFPLKSPSKNIKGINKHSSKREVQTDFVCLFFNCHLSLKKQVLVDLLWGFGLTALSVPKFHHFGMRDLSTYNHYQWRRELYEDKSQDLQLICWHNKTLLSNVEDLP